jgi:transcriptional regulator with PAS, ATPase and Fis domain
VPPQPKSQAQSETPADPASGAAGEKATLPLAGARARIDPAAVRRFQLTVVEGPQLGAVRQSNSDKCSVGSHALNDFVIDDPTVSRFHCEVRIAPEGARVRDLDSLNGTIVDGVGAVEAFLRGGSLLRLGRAVIRFDFSAESNRLPLSDRASFGSLIGASVAMRGCFALMERAAATDSTVLLEGETGTGKTRAAMGIHEEGARKDGPFIVIDCAAIPSNLLESELFGHEKGSFTGAQARRIGAFEEASGGTIFLDEIGELPAELQPKLLRVLENREIRRVGSNSYQPVDVRVIAATNRDLRAAVNSGSFRADLYFRLAVIRIHVPALRQRPEDIPALVEQVVASIGNDAQKAQPLREPDFIARLQQSAWPGNIRELRNYIERCLVFEDALPLTESLLPSQEGQVDVSQSYATARRRALDQFERTYLQALLARHQGKVTLAAAAAEMDRVYFYRLLRRHGIKP